MHCQAIQVIIQKEFSMIGLRVNIEDNNIGSGGKKVKKWNGLKVIRDRVQMFGGTMEIHSTVGHGVHILFLIPSTNAAPFA